MGLEHNIQGCVCFLIYFFLKIATVDQTHPKIVQDKDEHQDFINQIIQGYE